MAGQLGIWLSEPAMWGWLTRAADELAGPDRRAGGDEHFPAIGYGWRPRDPGAPWAAEHLIRQAAAVGVLRLPQAVAVALEHRPACPGEAGAGAGTYRVLATIDGPDGAEPLTITSPARPWEQIIPPGIAGPRAAAGILAGVAEAANRLLDGFDGHARHAVAGRAA